MSGDPGPGFLKDAATRVPRASSAWFLAQNPKIYKSKNPKSTAKAIVEATTHYKNPEIIAKVSEGMGDAMKGLEISQLDVRMQERGK